MSESHRQQTFGQPTFTDASVNGSSSGRDRFDLLDVTSFYHQDDEYQGHRLHPLQIPSLQDGFAHGQHFAYPSHSSGVSLPGMRMPLFNYNFIRLHMLDTHIISIPCNCQPAHSLLVGAVSAVLGCWS